MKSTAAICGSEISDSVEECASEAISNYMEYYEHDVDFTEGASNLLHEYNPGNGCSLARDFEAAVQGAVLVNGWLAGRSARSNPLTEIRSSWRTRRS